MIVAIASLKNLDIVCTEDNNSMASSQSIKAYEKINSKNGLRIPKFIGFEEFKQKI